MTINDTTPQVPCPPSTSDFLEFHALQNPHQVAIDWNGQAHTYAQLHHDLLRVTQQLYLLGLRPGQLALVHQSNPYLQILLQLACENLRVTYASLPSTLPSVLFEKADVFLSCIAPPPLKVRVHLLDNAWLTKVSGSDLIPDLLHAIPAAKLDDKLLVTRSSGTTGVPKLIRLSRSQFDYSAQSLARDRNFSNSTVCLVLYGFEVAIIWRQICACLRSGGTAVWGQFIEVAKKYELTHIWMLPVDVVNFLDKIPSDWKKTPGLVLYTAGAQLPELVRSKARQILCDAIVNTYGANEVSVICELDKDNKGTIKPGVELRIVNEKGQSLPLGDEGDIAVRTPGMTQEYWQQPEYTATNFREGWFYPGDRGKFLAPRLLQYLGRNDELLNFGGMKQPPEIIEKFFKSLPGVLDAAATSKKRADGVDVLLVAVVLHDALTLNNVQQTARVRLSAFAAQMQIFCCESIPRTPNGKIKRLAIRELSETEGKRPTESA